MLERQVSLEKDLIDFNVKAVNSGENEICEYSMAWSNEYPYEIYHTTLSPVSEIIPLIEKCEQVVPETSVPETSVNEISEQNVPEEETRKYNDRARQRKARLSNKVADDIYKNIGKLPLEEQVSVLEAALKKLHLYDHINKQKIKNKRVTGRQMTSFEIRKKVWTFLHNRATPSTITSRPSKLRVDDKPKIQTNLDFVDTCSVITQRNCFFYESNWFVVQETLHNLYNEYINNFSVQHVSFGTFYSLKPFYIRHVTEKDIEMCVCKKHLHARWGINGLIELAKLQGIHIDFDCYAGFFNFISRKCKTGECTYLGAAPQIN